MGNKKAMAGSIPVRSTKKSLDNQGFSSLKEKSGRKVGQDLPAKCALLEEFKSKYRHMSHLPYKKARLYNANGDISKNWYVEFYYQIPNAAPGSYQRFKERFDINRIKSLQERTMYGKEMVAFINEKLESGFNPFNTGKVVSDEDFLITSQLTKIINTLSATASKISVATYNEVKNRFCKWLTDKKYTNIQINNITIQHAKAFKKWALHEKNLSVKTVNNSLSHLSMFWDEAIESGFTNYNPFKALPKAKMRDKQGDEKDVRFEPFTNEELEQIFPWLKAHQYTGFINFLSVIYYAWARPVEILRLKVEDIEINKHRNVIRFKKHNTKNDQAAYVQIVPPLLEVFKSMKLNQYPGDYYLFSDGYIPGKRAFNKSNPSKTWRNTVKKKIGISKDMYALKHTGNIEYLLNNKGNVDLKWQQMQNRHSSTAITDRYNKKLGAYFIEMSTINFRILNQPS